MERFPTIRPQQVQRAVANDWRSTVCAVEPAGSRPGPAYGLHVSQTSSVSAGLWDTVESMSLVAYENSVLHW